MVSVYLQIHQLREAKLFRPWLFKIAVNRLRKHFRDTERDIMPLNAEETVLALPATAADPLARCTFGEWMGALAPDERELMTLRYLDGLEYHEIAEVMKMARGTVQWKLFHSRKKLAARFGAAPSSEGT